MLYRKAVNSSRLAFFIAGLALASWAPLIPLTKERLNLEEGGIGTVLLAFGLGSLLMMPISGSLAARFGCRTIFTLMFFCMLLTLPCLAMLHVLPLLMIALFFFGGAIGAMDVVINIHAVTLEKNLDKPIMSSMHALFSLGGLVGAGSISLLLNFGFSALFCVLVVIIFLSTLMLITYSGMMNIAEKDDTPFFVLPKGKVIFLGAFCCIAFLIEGAMLDWSGILLSTQHHLATNQTGIGYTLFAVTMTCGRFMGDTIMKKLGGKKVFLVSSLATILGLCLLILSTQLWITALAFLVIGLGISNFAPLLFTAAGQQTDMSDSTAIAAVATLGYAGILLGPALIGGIAHVSSIYGAFASIALVFILLTIMFISLKIKI